MHSCDRSIEDGFVRGLGCWSGEESLYNMPDAICRGLQIFFHDQLKPAVQESSKDKTCPWVYLLANRISAYLHLLQPAFAVFSHRSSPNSSTRAQNAPAKYYLNARYEDLSACASLVQPLTPQKLRHSLFIPPDSQKSTKSEYWCFFQIWCNLKKQ